MPETSKPSSTRRAGSPARPETAPPTTPTAAPLVDALVDTIQARISSGELAVGTWLRQEKLAAEFGVSRMPVREALHELQAMGAVEIIANRGARVRLPSARDVAEIYELHGLLFGQAAAAAAQLITSEQIERLRSAVDQFYEIVADMEREPPDSEINFGSRWFQANSAFYDVLVDASDNRNLAIVIDRLHRLIPRNLTWLALRNDSRRVARDADEHKQIFLAIDEGESERARTLVMKRTRRASEMVVRVLNDSPAETASG